jgi:hypothetical protein
VHRIKNKIFAAVLFLPVVMVLAGCPGRQNIAQIERSPGRWAGREISVAGRVTNSFGAMGTGVYQIDDGTGRMWVFSEGFGIPGKDAKLAVSGRVQEGFSFGGKHFAMVLRQTQRPHYARFGG